MEVQPSEMYFCDATLTVEREKIIPLSETKTGAVHHLLVSLQMKKKVCACRKFQVVNLFSLHSVC